MPVDRTELLDHHVSWLGHAGFLIETKRRTIYIDPYRVDSGPSADVVLITHGHFDHFSPDDLQAVSRAGTLVLAPPTVAEQLKGHVVSMSAGEVYEEDGLDVRAIAAYNTNKLDSEGRPFHSRNAGSNGYVVTAGGFSVYHAGDTDVVPEMDDAAGVDIALLPISGTYVMSVTEAVEAARRIGAGVTVPMHWGTLAGDRGDADRFVELATVDARILEPRGSAHLEGQAEDGSN